MNPTKLECFGVKVIHCSNEGSFPIAGEKVKHVRLSLADAFNIPKDALPFVNGEQVDMCYTLSADDILEFVKQSGRKGIRRMFTKAEIHREYTGHAASVMAAIFSELPHDAVNTDGQSIWSEIAVDKWFDNWYSRTVDDGRDKMIPPDGIRINGQEFYDLTGLEYKLLDSVLSRSTENRRGASYDDVIEDVWGHDAGWKDDAIKNHVKRITEKFLEKRFSASVHCKKRFITIVK